MQRKISKAITKIAKTIVLIGLVFNFTAIGVVNAYDFGNTAGTYTLENITMDAGGLEFIENMEGLNPGMQITYELSGVVAGSHNGDISLYVSGDTDDTAEIFSTLPTSSIAKFGQFDYTPNGSGLTHNEYPDSSHTFNYMTNEDYDNPITLASNLTLTVTVEGYQMGPSQDFTDLLISDGEWLYFQYEVDAGTTELEVVTSSGTGNADLYHRVGDYPTTSTYDNSSTGGTNSETITISSPAAGTHYFGIYANGASVSGLALDTTLTEGGGGGAVPEFSDYMLILTIAIAIVFMYKMMPNIVPRNTTFKG